MTILCQRVILLVVKNFIKGGNKMAQLKAVPKAVSKVKVGGKAPAKATSKSGKTPALTKKEIGACAAEYVEVSQQIKVLEERKKLLAIKIKEGAVKFGTLDDKGSSYLEVNGFIAGNVSKVSMSLDQTKGVEYLEKKGLGDLVDVVEVKTVNEERLEKAVSEKRLTLDEVEGFTTKKQSYQVSVKAVEEMPEVEQSNLALAASKK